MISAGSVSIIRNRPALLESGRTFRRRRGADVDPTEDLLPARFRAGAGLLEGLPLDLFPLNSPPRLYLSVIYRNCSTYYCVLLHTGESNFSNVSEVLLIVILIRVSLSLLHQ